jgi:hypothetical protein
MSEGKVDYSDDNELRETIQLLRETPLSGLSESEHEWHLETFSISKVRPSYRIGWSFALQPESRLYKRWFDLSDLGKNGWAIIFRVWDASSNPNYPGVYEKFPGWVPPEREKEADQWITFLNAEIRARLLESGQIPVTPDPSKGAIPPPPSPDAVQLPTMIRMKR